MKTKAKITTRWTTICTVGYQGSVASGLRAPENRAAHGAVCHYQARRGANGIIGRKVNSNGRHQEVGEAFPIDDETLAHWERIEADSR